MEILPLLMHSIICFSIASSPRKATYIEEYHYAGQAGKHTKSLGSAPSFAGIKMF